MKRQPAQAALNDPHRVQADAKRRRKPFQLPKGYLFLFLWKSAQEPERIAGDHRPEMDAKIQT